MSKFESEDRAFERSMRLDILMSHVRSRRAHLSALIYQEESRSDIDQAEIDRLLRLMFELPDLADFGVLTDDELTEVIDEWKVIARAQ